NDYYRYNWDYDLGMGVYTFSTLQYYENTAEGYKKVQDTDHPLHKTAMRGFFSPQFVDVDGDGDLDIISGHEYGDVVFFRNDNGEYVNEMEFSPFAGLNVEYQAT